MDLSTEKQRPQLVEVVNNSEYPTPTEITNFPFAPDGISLRVTIQNPYVILSNRPHQASAYTVQFDNILFLQGDGTFVPIPLNSTFTNMTSSNINSLLQSYKTAYSTLVSGITAATLHYSKMNSLGVVTSEVYNLKD